MMHQPVGDDEDDEQDEKAYLYKIDWSHTLRLELDPADHLLLRQIINHSYPWVISESVRLQAMMDRTGIKAMRPDHILRRFVAKLEAASVAQGTDFEAELDDLLGDT